MRTTPLIAALFGASSVSAAINAAGVRSQTPYACNAVGGVQVTFSEDVSVMHAKFPNLNLYVDTPSHGFPPSYSIMYCIATVVFSEPDFGTGTNQHRFAIANVTWSNSNLTLEKGDNFNTLQTTVDLNIEVSNETTPVHYPIGTDKYSANLANFKANPAVGVDEPHSGEFTFTATNPKPYFTPCFLGRSAHVLNFDFSVFAETEEGGTSTGGWEVDFGLIYEDCHWTEESDNWGTTQIKDWESCTYHEATNTTSAKRGLKGLHHY
ncbi:hypothetical protein NPX13_g3118 [Xylaria arbuscula]|uniref:Ubiquitin 3 binding protein But2 C-terminal domain-containing protein n=1 Tax=Xylaria arbuscula TaxID=114810 RepID=A0A9W8TPN6_9PEZI|nr:hypothetical protein NPX13_g3118 [Xylaria arbuscula]